MHLNVIHFTYIHFMTLFTGQLMSALQELIFCPFSLAASLGVYIKCMTMDSVTMVKKKRHPPIHIGEERKQEIENSSVLC